MNPTQQNPTQDEIELPELQISLFDIMLILKRLAGNRYEVVREEEERSEFTTQVSIGPVVLPYPVGRGNQKLLIDHEKLKYSNVDLDEARLLMHRLKQEFLAYNGKMSVEYEKRRRNDYLVLTCVIIFMALCSLILLQDSLWFALIPGIPFALVGLSAFRDFVVRKERGIKFNIPAFECSWVCVES